MNQKTFEDLKPELYDLDPALVMLCEKMKDKVGHIIIDSFANQILKEYEETEVYCYGDLYKTMKSIIQGHFPEVGDIIYIVECIKDLDERIFNVNKDKVTSIEMINGIVTAVICGVDTDPTYGINEDTGYMDVETFGTKTRSYDPYMVFCNLASVDTFIDFYIIFTKLTDGIEEDTKVSINITGSLEETNNGNEEE